MAFDTSGGGGPEPCIVMQPCWEGFCNNPDPGVSDDDVTFLIDCGRVPCIGPCCGNPCCGDPCCGDPCCGAPDPCCGVNCDHGDPCTDDFCLAGGCVHIPVECPDDGDSCTDDYCDPATGECKHEPPDNDGDGLRNDEDPDVDGDGIPNPYDPDVDGDGTPNVNDPDIDGDCLSNGNDPDMDGDGIPNEDDGDTDGDGIPNEDDSQPDGCQGQCCEIVCNANPCLIYDCDDGACSFYANKPNCAPCPEGLCLGGECWGDACTLGLTSGSVVAGQSVALALTTGCTPPACGANVFWQITSANPAVQAFPANGVHFCPGDASLILVQVQGCASAGPTTLSVTGTTIMGDACWTTATVDVTCPTDCVNYGQITTGEIIVGPVPCVGGTVTFVLDGASDSGGSMGDSDGGPGGECCAIIPAVNPIGAVTPTVTWTITRPSPLGPVEGTGYFASALAEAVGDYSVVFTVSVDRECAPPPVSVGPETVTVVGPDLALSGVAEQDEENPGGFLCVNDDDDNNNDTPDKDDPGPTAGEDDLKAFMMIATGLDPTVTVTLSVPSGASKVRIYENADRSNPVTVPASWPADQVPSVYYLEGVAASAAVRDVELKLESVGGQPQCADVVKLTVIRAQMDPVTSGIDPVPINPAIVAPVDVGLDDGTIFAEGNKFALTTLQPDIDLSTLPVSWFFALDNGFINPNVVLTVDADKRGARLVFPLPSFGNLGSGHILFGVGQAPMVCASVDTLVRNIQPDLEPGDFRFHVRAHLCHDGQGTGTTRTQAEIKAIMSDVTKVLSQCGVIVTTSAVVNTEVPTFLVDDLGSGAERLPLFDYDEHETDIDMYFVIMIDSGTVAGTTLSPFASLQWEAGIAIADVVDENALTGQDVVRTTAHELAHYLLNHYFGEDDHTSDPKNLMYPGTSFLKRDLDTEQCLEMRENFGVD